MAHIADGWNYIKTTFVLWKCQNCYFHFAVAEGSVSEGKKVKCPTCGWEVGYEDKVEEFDVVIDYYG